MTEGSFSAKKKERVAIQRRYQIDQQRAVQQFRQMAREENPNIQMIVPMAEVVGLLQEGVGHLLREAGLALMNLVMEEEVRHLAGERYQQHPERHSNSQLTDCFVSLVLRRAAHDCITGDGSSGAALRLC